jgi:hypothetical protein
MTLAAHTKHINASRPGRAGARRCRYPPSMSELLESAANVLAYVLVASLLGWGLYRAFGSQVLGLPTLIGVLVIAAALSVFSSAVVLLAMVIGLVVLMLVIGMAMTLGPEPPSGSGEERPMDDFRP